MFPDQMETLNSLISSLSLPKETVTAKIMLDKNTNVNVSRPDGNTEFFDIVAESPKRNCYR